MRVLGVWLVCLLSEFASAGSWTKATSEEHGKDSPAVCQGGVSGAHCSGRYCDNIALKCSNEQGISSTTWWSPYFSEEGRNHYVCADGLMTGVRCSGRYCDNLSLRCQKKGSLSLRGCYWSQPFSEESGGRLELPKGMHVVGVRCEGRYCDRKSLRVCRTQDHPCQSKECVHDMAEKFAPVLRFDQKQGRPGKCFPQDAQSYWDTRKRGDRRRICNLDLGDHIPTYYKAQHCGANTTMIAYWFFYGWQDPCTGSLGSHDADWEHVVVKVVNGKMSRIKYAQHKGDYTKHRRNVQMLGEHPVVYVGKNSHGSYHDDGGSGSCLYFQDYRNPGSKNQALHTRNHLVRFERSADSPAWMNASDGRYFDGISGPLNDADLCNLRGCNGKDARIAGLCVGTCGCAKSDIGDLPL